MSSEKESDGGSKHSNSSNNSQPLALAYPTEEERNITLEPNQPRQPHNLQDLLRFSVEASRSGQNASENSAVAFASLDEERRRFLENALQSLTIDVIEELLKSIQVLQRAGNLELEEDPTECEQALEKIASYVDHIDIANDFHKIGGFCVFQPCLNSPHSSIRWRAAEVIAELTQNNPYCQEKVLESKLLPVLLSLVDTDPNMQVRIKALYALSCLIRESDRALREFGRLEGYSVLMRAMQSGMEKLQIKSSFLLSYICFRCPSLKDELCKMGFVVQLAGLVSEGSPPALEHLLSALLALVKDHEPSKEECRSAQLQLKSTLCNLLRQNSDKEERRDMFREPLFPSAVDPLFPDARAGPMEAVGLSMVPETVLTQTRGE